MKGKHVVARRDAVLDRSSTLLTSTKKVWLMPSFFLYKECVNGKCSSNCHGKLSSRTQFELSWQVYKQLVMARGLVPRGDLGSCHYERSEVIKKQVLLASRLRQSLRSIASDKSCGVVRLQ